MIQSYGQQYAPSSPESGSLDDESQMGAELDSIAENTVQPHTSGELFKHCIILSWRQTTILFSYYFAYIYEYVLFFLL